jgi:hypothetical protein
VTPGPVKGRRRTGACHNAPLSPGHDDRDDPKQKKSGLLIVSCNPQLYLIYMLQRTLPARLHRAPWSEASGPSWRTSFRRRNRRGENDAVPSRQSNEIIICGPKADGTYWVEFRTADGRLLESEARVPPHYLEAVHSRLQAAQVVQV